MSDFIKRLSNSNSLTDILIQMEDFLDSLDIFVFKNWFEGEIADGPTVERHWVSMILKYDYNQMPDPDGGLRLLKYGARVVFKESVEEDTDNANISLSDIENQNENNQYENSLPAKQMKPKMKKIWLVEVKIPRHFIDELTQMDDLNDTDVDSEHLKAAHDSDLQAKDAYSDKEDDDSTQDEITGEADQESVEDQDL